MDEVLKELKDEISPLYSSSVSSVWRASHELDMWQEIETLVEVVEFIQVREVVAEWVVCR